MHICKNIIALCAMAIIAVSNCSNSTSEKKFRIGFEFQTAGSILGNNVPWKFQKVPLFEVFYKGKKLWHIEIDGGDIEFVTAAFANDEEGSSLLKMCGSTITEASKTLRDISKVPNKSLFYYFDTITYFMRGECFKDFEVRLDDVIHINNPVYFCDKEEQILVSGISDTDIIMISRKDGEFKNIATITSKEIDVYNADDLKNFIKDKLSTCVVCNLNDVITYLQNDDWEVKIQRNNKPDISQDEINKIKIHRTVAGWNGIFQPHVTIQMPLEKIVDVYNKLYSNLDTIGDTTTMHSLKMIDAEHKKIKKIIGRIETNLRNERDIGIEKIKGLIFLQAYTMKSMCPEGENPEGSLLRCFYATRQVNAKAKLIMMSRRPFSEMFKEINYEKKQETYTSAFKTLKNSLQLGNIKGSDYGRKFGRDIRMAFTDLPKQYTELAQAGILTPSMVPFITGVGQTTQLQQYLEYESIINSVPNPPNRVIVVHQDEKITYEVNHQETNYDLLSPPVLLNTSQNDQKLTDESHRDVDSMGAYKKNRAEYETEKYGEAIVEFRGISYAITPINSSDGKPSRFENFLSEAEHISPDMDNIFKTLQEIFKQ